MRRWLVVVVVASGLLLSAAPAGAETADDSNVHGCAITMRAVGGVGIDLRRYSEAYVQGANSPACGDLRVGLTIVTNDNGTTRAARTRVDQADYGPPFPTDNFTYGTWQHGSFRYAQVDFSWCPGGGDSCATRTHTRATMYKGGPIMFG